MLHSAKPQPFFLPETETNLFSDILPDVLAGSFLAIAS